VILVVPPQHCTIINVGHVGPLQTYNNLSLKTTNATVRVARTLCNPWSLRNSMITLEIDLPGFFLELSLP